jgi:hypothetical protein
MVTILQIAAYDPPSHGISVTAGEGGSPTALGDGLQATAT